MSGDELPADLLYSVSHEWLDRSAPEWRVGITDHAQAELTDIVFVEVIRMGQVMAGDLVAEVESTKTVGEIYAPVDGEIVAANDALGDDPGLVNRSPYGDGWLFRMVPASTAMPPNLLSADQYRSQLQQ